MAAQKKSPVAPEREEEAMGLVALAGFSLRRQEACVRGGVGLQYLHVARLRARAPKGKRAYGRVPRNRAKNTTLIAAITLQGAIRASR
jgi:hypothetical protein